jgi:predicted ATPase/DNA-binding SARP family transcriptional activator
MSDKTDHSPRDVPFRDPSKDGTGSLLAFPRTRPSKQRPPDNLPLELSSFVGREREVAEIKGLLAERRLVSLIGPGGCGKTRLALAVAHEMVEGFEDGVWWVELASLSEPKLVAGAVVSALGVREAPDLSPTEMLVEHLEPRKALLVLDNCEHLIEGCAVLADALLRSCPNLGILATSREPLRIAGESTWPVPSLSLPDSQQRPPAKELARYEAIRLFVERAGAADTGFTLTDQNASAVARLCRKLDGIPLAIELAAARVRALTVEQISERLEDPLGLLTTGSRTAAPRHQTLRATLQWSYELLDERERELFNRLSVFAGGWDLEAAEAVGAGGPVEAGQVLDLLSNLVDKSLVVVEPSPVDAGALRYGMLEPVRQYALERLVEGGEVEETRRRHAAFFLALAEEARPKVRAEVEWLERLEQENANLRGALSWAHAADDISTAARLGWALHVFWWSRNHQPEGRQWIEPILQRREELPLRSRIQATIVAAVMAFGQGDTEAVERYCEELMGYSREAGGDAYADSYAHAGLGLVVMLQGDFEASKKHLEEALPLFREAGEDGQAASTYSWLGTVLLLQGDHEGARRSFKEGLALGRSIGDRLSICTALFNLAQLALAGGDYDAAFDRFAEGIAPSEELGDRGNIAYLLEGLGVVAGARGEAGRAARLLGASEALTSAIGLRGHTYYQPDRALYERINGGVRATLGEAAFAAALDEGRAMSPEQAIEYALGEVEEPAAASLTAAPVPEQTPSAEKPAETAEEAKTTIAELRVLALGPARVEKGGRPLASSPDWIQKPRELLFYLLSHPQGRTKEQIGLALWPEASTAQLRSSFHDTIFRLRRALGGKEWISFEKGRYTFNRSLDYFFDVEAFEGNLSEARRLQAEVPEQAIQHLQKAADLYGGDFLENLSNREWAMGRQEELQGAYRNALLLLGRLLFAQDRYTEAAEAYRKAISQDDLLEEAHRGLMRCQAALGERVRALRHYEELVELLEEQLGTAPAPETSTLYESLRAGEEV